MEVRPPLVFVKQTAVILILTVISCLPEPADNQEFPFRPAYSSHSSAPVSYTHLAAMAYISWNRAIHWQ